MSTAASKYSKEGATLKDKAKKLIEAFVQEQNKRKAAGLKVHGDEPRMALRALRSILLSPDSIYGDLLEKALSEGWSGEVLKNKVRVMMEGGAHRRFSPAPHFMGHHTGGSLGSLGPSAQAAKPNVLRRALIEVTERGAKLGESGLTWLPEYAHTGAINRRLKKLGLSHLDTPGISYLNAHLGDKKFTGYNVPAIAGVGSADDLIASWWDSGVIPQQLLDAQIGIEAATSELDELAKVAKEFGLNIDKNPGEVQKLLRKNPQLLERVVKAGKSPTIDTVPSFAKRVELGNLPSSTEGIFSKGVLSETVENTVKQTKNISKLRKAAKIGALAGVGGISILGTGASFAETTTRTAIAAETGNWLDKTQAGISGFSLANDLGSYSGVWAIPGGLLSTAADLTNVAIDSIRFPQTDEEKRIAKEKRNKAIKEQTEGGMYDFGTL